MSTPVTQPEAGWRLPAPLSPIIGRERECAALLDLLARPIVRLVTLTGPGGIGKTRLAVDVARASRAHFADGVCFVPLDVVRDPDLVLPTIATAVGVREEANAALHERLGVALRERDVLLLLDNFEQVNAAAPLLASLLADCPRLKALVTSRVPLEVYGEREYPLGPLPTAADDLADAEQLASVPAIRLFVERAGEVKPDFALTDENAPVVAEICRRLDGLPLAIELAAARCKLLSPAALLDQLADRLQILTDGPRDQPRRLRTMRAAIGWSYDLLSPDERALFRRLAVFDGGFTLDAAEAVSRGVEESRSREERSRAIEESVSQKATNENILRDSATPRLLDSLAALANGSLLRRASDGSEIRFDMYQTIRAFGREQLAASGEEAAVRRAHAAVFAALADRAGPELIARQQQEWFTRLETEHANLRAALTWATGVGDATTAQRLAGNLWRFWFARGHFHEGSSWLERALAVPGEVAAPLRGLTLVGAGSLVESQGDYDRAQGYYAAARDLGLASGDRRAVALATDALGNVAHDRGDYPLAIELHDEARRISHEIGDKRLEASAIHNLGTVAYYQGDIAEAETRYSDALDLFREIGDERARSVILGNLGVLAYARGDFARARELQEECLAAVRRLGDQHGEAGALSNLGEIHQRQGDLEGAADLYGQAHRIFERLGAKRSVAIALLNLGRVAHAQGEDALAAARLVESLERARQVPDQAAIVQCLDGLAVAASALGDPLAGARLAGAAHALSTAIGFGLTGPELDEQASDLEAIRNAAGADAFAAAWAVGMSAPLDDMLAEAREVPKLATPSPDAPAADEAARRVGLTRRELEVLRLFVAGQSNREIAAALQIGLPLVTHHIGRLYTKLDVETRADVAAFAFKLGLV